MNKISLILFVFLNPLALLAQNPIADFNLPAEICLEEQLQLENTSTDASHYEWDFCPGDLSSNNILFKESTNGSLSTPVGASLIEFNGSWYGFITNISNNTITKLEFGNSLNNEPTISNMGNPGNALDNPQDVKAVTENDSIYLFISNRNNNKFVRINLAEDISNPEPTVDILLPGNRDLLNNGVEVVKDGENWIAIYSGVNLLRIINLGSNLSNIPEPADILVTSSFAGVNNIGDISFVKENNNWYGFIVGYSSRTLHRLNFGINLFANPSVSNITPTDLSSEQPYSIKFLKEGAQHYAFISTISGNLLRMDFGESVLNPLVFNLLGKFGVLSNTLKLDFIKNDSKFLGLTSIWNANRIVIIDFINDCPLEPLFSSEIQPVISFSSAGTYAITLTAYQSSKSNSTTKEITVSPNTAPTGEILLDSAYCIADIISFSFETTDNIVSYLWDFSDGNSSTAIAPTHQFLDTGTYSVSLVIESEAGCINTYTKMVEILAEPIPEFSTSKAEYCTFESIDFMNNTLGDYGNNIRWSWDFNGEASSTEENPSFVFGTSGTKNIILEINVLGCIQTYSTNLNVIEGPQVNFSYNNNCLNESIQFTNLSTGDNITGFNWTFGNGESSTDENPTVSYNIPGEYEITLTVKNAANCENTSSQNIQVLDQIIDSIFVTEAIENIPFFVSVDWLDSFDSTQMINYKWEINGSMQNRDTAAYTLPQGTYELNLEVVTESGCIFNHSRTINVVASEFPTVSFSSPVEVCLDELILLESNSINTSRINWDFCSGDLTQSEIVIAEKEFNRLSTPVGSSLIKVNNNWFGFITNIGNNSITRISFGESIHNTEPIIEDLGNYGGLLSGPQAIKAIYDGSNYYLFVANRTKNKFIRIKLGDNLINNNPETKVLLSGDSDVPNNGVEIVEDNGNWYAFYTRKDSYIKLSFADSLSNNNFSQDISATISGVNNIGDIDFIKSKGNWLGFIVGSTSKSVHRLNFGNTLANTFVSSENITKPDISTFSPYGIRAVLEGGKYYIYIATSTGNILRLDFNNSLEGPFDFNLLGNYGILNNTFKFDIASGNSEWLALSSNWQQNKIYLIKFPNVCNASTPISNDIAPIISYSTTGTYPITLTAYHPSGNSVAITNEITVADNQAPDITFSRSEDLCISIPIQFSSESNTEISSYSWDFGDGNSSTEANPAHLFSNAGQYLVRLSVTDTAGCNNLFQDSITIYAEPQPNFLANLQGSICSQKPVIFENTTALPTTATFRWDFGDGTTSTEESPEHIYASEGEYIVNFQIAMAGCLVEKIDTITVNPGPLVDFNYSDDCFGQIINFQNLSTGYFLQSFQWDFGDGTNSTQTSPNHSYDSAGTYKVQLTALTSNDCDYTYEQEVIIHPVATVAFESEVGCANRAVQFNEQVALQQSNVTDYLWDFGVSGTSSDISTGANPEYTFPTAGTYEVSLQVTTADGCTSSGTQAISVNALPQPAFDYEHNCLNNAILFSPENTDNIIGHFWELQNEEGDIIFTAQSENFSYAFENAGTYELRYRQQNENLCSNSITETVEILPIPEPDFQVGNICANEAVFLENVTDLKGNTLKSYEWSINGTIISTDFRLKYTFEESGEFLLSLQVETQNGCIQSVEKTINVSPSPVAFFELEQTLAAFPFALNLNPQDYPFEGITGVLWILNNDTISSNSELNYVIEQPGTYLLGLILTNQAGCIDSHYEQIRIREPNLDIALSNLRITQDQDFTGFILNISNRGTLVPERLDLEINLGSYSVTETIEEPLLPERNRNVALSLKLTEEQIRGLSKICIRAIPHSAAANESNENNNRVCTNIESGLNIMEIYPNPVATKFTLPIIIPENANVKFNLEQSSGQTVKTFSYDLEAGYHEIQIDRDNFKPGIYFLRIRYQGEEKVKKIIFQ